MIEDILKKIDLKPKEIQVFLALFRVGEATASMIAGKVKLPRTTVFDTLAKLAKKGIVHRYEKFGQFYFGCEDENVLLNYIHQEQIRWTKNQSLVEKILPLLHNIRAPYSPAPTIRFYEGATEVSAIYEDILKTGEDILLLRSMHDHDDEELTAILAHYLPRQVKRNIHVRALTPWVETTVENFLNSDEQMLMERRVYDREQFSLPAQVLIYGGKVAVITLRNQIFGTVLEHQDVVHTMRIVFELLWKQAEESHGKFLKAVEVLRKKRKVV